MRIPSIHGRRWRLIALALLVLALAPGTWLRTPVTDRNSTAITVTALPFSAGGKGGFVVEGVWQLSGKGERFGGYSAMGLLDDAATIRLFSDRGWLLTLPRPDLVEDAASQSSMRRLFPTGIPMDQLFDIESVTYDHAADRFWVGYEFRHTIYRYAGDGEPDGFLEPPFTRQWSDNGGIEAMARLESGEFLLLRESGGEGYLIDGDPVAGARYRGFRAGYPEGYSPTDVAQLPDGRVLIILRRVAFANPVFEAMLAIADPDQLGEEPFWQVTPLVQIEDILPRENYEAIAIDPKADGSVTVWLASDDNISVFQRSLLAKLHFTPESPAEGGHEKGRRAEAPAP